MPTSFLFRAAVLPLVCLCTCVRAQQLILYQGFENSDAEGLTVTPSVPPYGSGGLPTFGPVSRIRGIDSATEGALFWAVRDADNPLTAEEIPTLSFDAGEICSLTSARFVFDYRVVGYDGGDDFGYVLYLDGFAGQRQVLVDGRNGGGVSTEGWVSDTVRIPGTAQTARLELYFDQNGDDVAAVDNVRLLATGTNGSCQGSCGIRLERPTVNCTDFTAMADELLLSLPYAGGESGAVVSLAGVTIGGDDPATVADGRIELSGLREGRDYLLEITGGDCAIEYPISYPADQCAPSSLVINEVMAAPADDTNGDGTVSSSDEFVEIYNQGSTAVDIGGYTLHDASNSGVRFRFPEGTMLNGGAFYVVFAGAGPVVSSCEHGVANGFLGLNDNTPETVTLRDPDGKIVARAAFDDAPDGESLVLSPDGNLAGGHRPHSEVNGQNYSICGVEVDLPVVLLDFTATGLGDAVRLDWQTTEETDNERFVVERSKSGQVYTDLASVPAGNGQYAYVDEDPFPGQNLYRLRQLDYDGTATVYGPVYVRLDSGTISLYPNPTTGKLYLTGEVGAEETVTVFSSEGRSVYRAEGARLNLRHLPAGSYYLRLQRPSGTYSLRFIKE